MTDSSPLRGTPLTRGQMTRRGLGRLALGAALIAAVLTVVEGVLGPLAFLAGLVLVCTGAGRLLWAWRRSKVDLLSWLALAWVVGLGVVALLAPWLPLPEGRNATVALSEPIYLEPLKFSDHPLGTNGAGLDMLSRAVFGARASLIISLTAIVIGVVVGGLIGVVAGYVRKGTDRGIGIVTNAFLAVPPLILLVALAAILDPTMRNIALALSVLTIPSMVRVARANAIAFAQREFVLAARAIGASRARVMLRELVPNVALPLMSMAMVSISALIVAESSLSFLGLGIPQPEPTWGNMISEAQSGTTMYDHPFIVIVPGVFLFLTVFSFNLLGEEAQRRWDPRSVKL
ncbi:ABC transporter permease [Actinocorallia sp. B10E7]|uniref:ABC transporter permease n=1 Tax=Actinocorallia sp. B10E7 TaxID=3153558 RepID=UPI00325D8BBE